VLAKAIPAAGPMAIPTLRSLLKHPAPPVRMEAAMSLGKLNATEAIADLKPMLNDPEVRTFVAVALARLGDRDAEAIVEQMLQSPIFDVRVLGAQAYEGKGAGPWVQALLPALKDPNGLTRIRAAELLAPVAPEAALPVLLEASKDTNPVVRADVTRVFETTGLLKSAAAAEPADTPGAPIKGPVGLAELRRLLRDPDASIRLNAAATLLALARGGSR
jgi:HEAT repeat protein